jgi:hypothetical protein
MARWPSASTIALHPPANPWSHAGLSLHSYSEARANASLRIVLDPRMVTEPK